MGPRLIKRWIFHNTGAKLASLLLALALWFYISMGETIKRSFIVPLSWENIPVNLEPSFDSTSVVSIITQGPRSILSNIQGKDFFIPLDLSGKTAGKYYTYVLSPDLVRAPRGVEVLDVSPPRVSIFLERLKRE